MAGLLRLGVKHDIADSYGVTPIVYAKRLNHYQCASLIQNYNPQRPQDVLIPIESLAEHSNSIEKIACRKEAMSNIEQDVFYRVPSCDKEHSNLERVVQLQKHSLTIIEDLQSLRDACDEALDIESQHSDGDSYHSGDEGMGNNLSVRQGNCYPCGIYIHTDIHAITHVHALTCTPTCINMSVHTPPNCTPTFTPTLTLIPSALLEALTRVHSGYVNCCIWFCLG